ncbi:MAG: endonuclease VIII [Myxococcota bacterium]
MPEGPEIRRAADKIARKLLDRVIEEASFGLPRLRPFERELSGQRVTKIDTRGKAMLIHFENALSLYSHNQLYGRWYIRARDSYPKTNRSLRVALHTAESSALLYSASDIEVLDGSGVASHPFLSKLGPDILDEDVSRSDILEQLRSPRFRNRSTGSLYLDQAFVAGIGNYLRSEILYAARVHPSQKPSQLTAAQQRRLAEQTLVIGNRAYETGGITNAPRLVNRLKKQGLKRRRYRHAVFGRAGLPCYRCSSPIEKTTVASRRLYVCPACQGV